MWGRCREVCRGFWAPTRALHSTVLHISFHLFLHLPLSPPHSHTPTHLSQHPLYLTSYALPIGPYLSLHLSLLPPHPNTHPYTYQYPHISPCLLKVWQNYHGEVAMWRSFWQAPRSVVGNLFRTTDRFETELLLRTGL